MNALIHIPKQQVIKPASTDIMSRRGFLTAMLTSFIAPMFLPGGGRLWKRIEGLFLPTTPLVTPISAADFTKLLLAQLPIYTKEILQDIRPTDMLAAHVSAGEWNPFQDVDQCKDRLSLVYPKLDIPKPLA